MTTKPPSAVAKRIREESKRQGVTQIQLAERVGMNQQQISRRFTGSAPITVVEAELFAQALNVSVAWLFGETDVPARPELVDA